MALQYCRGRCALSDYICDACGWCGDYDEMIKLAAGDEVLWYCPECKSAECLTEKEADDAESE